MTPLRAPAPGGADTDPGTPCTSVCRIAPATGWCEGCLRSIDEIIAWGTMAPVEKRRIWATLERRAASVAKSHSGNTGNTGDPYPRNGPTGGSR